MSEPESEKGASEETPEEGVEPMPEAVPDDYLDQQQYDPAGRPL